MRTATYQDVLSAIAEGRLRVDPETGLIEGRRLDPRATWRPRALESVSAPGSPPYFRVTFVARGERFRCLAHRVVWFALRGPIPSGLTIDHSDFDRGNNRLSNLELVTMAENTRRAVAAGRLDPHAPKNWSISPKTVREIRGRLASGTAQGAVARELGLTPNVVNRIARGRTYRSVT